MSNQAGKGDSPRPVNRAAWDAAWERIEASKRAKVVGGSFVLMDGGRETTAIPFDATPDDIAAALEDVTEICFGEIKGNQATKTK